MSSLIHYPYSSVLNIEILICVNKFSMLVCSIALFSILSTYKTVDVSPNLCTIDICSIGICMFLSEFIVSSDFLRLF